MRNVAAGAVGFDEERGDQLTVENISFDDNMPTVPEAPKTMVERVTTVVQSDQVQGLGRTLGVILLAVLAFFLFLKPVMNRALTAPSGQTIALPAVVAGRRSWSVTGIETKNRQNGTVPQV